MSLGGILTDLDGFTGSLAGTLVPNSGGNIVDLRSEQNLAAWYDASNSANLTVDSVGRVSQWNDTSTFASRHLTQATAGSQPIYLPWSGQNYGYLPGVAGNYFSTPDSAAVSVTGDIDIAAKVTALDWTPAGDGAIIGKLLGGAYSYGIVLVTTGVLRLYYSINGTTLLAADSTVATGVSDGAEKWVRVTRASATGVVKFYTGDNGTTWNQLGADVAGTSGALFDTTTALTIGAIDSGTTNLFTGRVAYAEIRNGIGGSVVAAFDPSRATDGASSFVAATGETWTVNTSGGKPAQIVGRASVMFDGVDDSVRGVFTLDKPTSLYIVLRQLTWVRTANIFDGATAGDSLGLVQYDAASPKLSLYAGAALETSLISVAGTHVIAAIFNGGSSLIQGDRGVAVTGNAGAVFSAGGLNLGAWSSAARFSNIQVSALAAFSTAHDARTRARVVNYLVSRYSIPV